MQVKSADLHGHPDCSKMFSGIGLLTSVRQGYILISFGRTHHEREQDETNESLRDVIPFSCFLD
jgi:hypothetical protein